MTYLVTNTGLSNLVLNPSDTVTEVLQNVAMILATPKGSIPHYREFGLDMGFLDRPVAVIKPLIYAAVLEAVQTFETRATVQSVAYTFGDTNEMTVSVEVEISE